MSLRARARSTATLCILSVSVLAACNAILGVTDVRPRKTTADGGPEPGDDDDTDPGEPIDSSVTHRLNVLSVVLGEGHACARKPAGTVRCWGDDSQGQTGIGGADGGFAAAPVDVRDLTDAVDIAAGRSHTCAAKKSGKVACWGYGIEGQLGNGQSGKSLVPSEVVGIDNAFLVAAGGNFSCAVRGTGTVACWGGNAHGQLGSSDPSGTLTPVVVQNLKDVVAISAGQSHACAVTHDGSVFCWGEGENGQLGNGSTDLSRTPVLVPSLPNATGVAAGERSTCALTATGSVLCWGANEVGQLGSGAPNSSSNPSPITVADLRDAVAIAAGSNHTCAVRKTGEVVCWGDGSFGQLGDNATHDAGAAHFVVVAAIRSGFRAGAGSQTTCATTQSDEVLCWGLGDRGQLGAGVLGSTTAPTAVLGYP